MFDYQVEKRTSLYLRPLLIVLTSIFCLAVVLQVPKAFSQNLNPLDKDSDIRKGLRETDPSKLLRKNGGTFRGTNGIISDRIELPKNAKYILQAPRSDFHRWYLDIDGHAEPATYHRRTVARNFMLTKENGPRWLAIEGKDGVKLALQAPRSKFHLWYLDVDGHADAAEYRGRTVARNVILTKEDGPEWWAGKGEDGVRLSLQAPKSRFDGWYLDVDGHAKSDMYHNRTVPRNFILTKEKGPEWRAITE